MLTAIAMALHFKKKIIIFPNEQGRIGCPQYQSPEVVSRGYYGKGCDIWGAGVLLHVLLSGRLPFLGSGKRLREVISGGRVVVAYNLYLSLYSSIRRSSPSPFSLHPPTSLEYFQIKYLLFSSN